MNHDLIGSVRREDGLLQTLACLAHEANQLAKQLDGARKKSAYHIKSSALSALIVLNAAVPNGVNADGTFAFDIRVGRGSRLHCRPWDLHPDARRIASQAESVPVIGPVSARLPLGQANALREFFREASGLTASEEK